LYRRRCARDSGWTRGSSSRAGEFPAAAAGIETFRKLGEPQELTAPGEREERRKRGESEEEVEQGNAQVPSLLRARPWTLRDKVSRGVGLKRSAVSCMVFCVCARPCVCDVRWWRRCTTCSKTKSSHAEKKKTHGNALESQALIGLDCDGRSSQAAEPTAHSG